MSNFGFAMGRLFIKETFDEEAKEKVSFQFRVKSVFSRFKVILQPNMISRYISVKHRSDAFV